MPTRGQYPQVRPLLLLQHRAMHRARLHHITTNTTSNPTMTTTPPPPPTPHPHPHHDDHPQVTDPKYNHSIPAVLREHEDAGAVMVHWWVAGCAGCGLWVGLSVGWLIGSVYPARIIRAQGRSWCTGGWGARVAFGGLVFGHTCTR